MSLSADAILDRRRLKRRLLAWRITAIVALLALLALGVGRVMDRGGPHVARLSVDGIIVEDPERDRALAALAEDENAQALIVRINSPGGTTTGSEELYSALRRVAAKKPVVAVIGTLGASGGYIAAVAADHIIARETSLTGSIGVVMQTADLTGLLENLGVKTEALKSGPLKGQPSPFEPLTPEGRAATRELIDSAYRWFVDLVAMRRALSPEQAAEVSDGRVFSGRAAKELRLVDGLGGEIEARGWLEAAHQVSTTLPVIDVSYGEPESLATRLVSHTIGKAFSAKALTLDGLLSVWQPDWTLSGRG